MKHILKLGVFMLVAQVMFLNSCVEPDDLMTADVKTGGMVIPSTNLLLKAGAGQNFDVIVEIPRGPGIVSLELTKVFNQGDTLLSNVGVMATVDVNSENANDTAFISFSLGYAELRDGLTLDGEPMPEDELDLGIGDRWTIYYTSVMTDGRKVLNNLTTVISVSNKYAGYYLCEGTFTHPTAGPRPISEEKFLSPVSTNQCWTTVGDLGGGYEMVITVDLVSNECTVVPGTNYALANPVAIVPGSDNFYDPLTGNFTLNYQYAGSGGNRVVDEVYTPLEK
jgi:hypothetical protein